MNSFEGIEGVAAFLVDLLVKIEREGADLVAQADRGGVFVIESSEEIVHGHVLSDADKPNQERGGPHEARNDVDHLSLNGLIKIAHQMVNPIAEGLVVAGVAAQQSISDAFESGEDGIDFSTI